MKYTINDIARLAGVGKSTVSRVLNNDPKVHFSTREKVQMIIDSVDFRPNQNARAMRGAVDPVVAIIVTRLNSNSESQTLSAILNELYRQNITPIIVESQFQTELVSRYFHLFKQRKVDGIILFSFSQLPLTVIKQWKGALVTIARQYQDISSIVYDDCRAVNLLLQQLYQNGHRTIGYLGVNPQDETTGKLRNQSYLTFCKQYQLKPHLVQTELGAENGYQAVATLFQQPISAILCASSSLAVGAFKYMQETQQIRPLAYIGQNELLRFVVPNSINVDFGYLQAGKSAVELLKLQLSNPSHIEQRLIECQLITS